MRRELASLPLFLDVAPDDLDHLAARFQVRSLAAGAPVFIPGEPVDSFTIVLRGALAVTPAQRAGADVALRATRGSVLGEVAMLRGEDTFGYATAAVPSVVLIGDFETFVAMLDLPTVRDEVHRIIISRLRRDARPIPATIERRPVIIRPLLPSDRAPFALAFRELSRESVVRRFFTAKSPSDKAIDYLVNIDYIDHFAYVIIDQDLQDGMGVARYIRSHDDPRSAEIALTVVDRYHGIGVGTMLLGALAVPATAAGIDTFTASILADNTAVGVLLRKADADLQFDGGGTRNAVVGVRNARSLLAPDLEADLEGATRNLLVAVGSVLAMP